MATADKVICKCDRPMFCEDDTRPNFPFITCIKCGRYPREKVS